MDRLRTRWEAIVRGALLPPVLYELANIALSVLHIKISIAPIILGAVAAIALAAVVDGRVVFLASSVLRGILWLIAVVSLTAPGTWVAAVEHFTATTHLNLSIGTGILLLIISGVAGALDASDTTGDTGDANVLATHDRKEDLLSRDELIQHLAEYVADSTSAAQQETAVALEGSWGTGKTFVLKRVARELRARSHSPVVLEINAALNGTPAALSRAYVDGLSSELRRLGYSFAVRLQVGELSTFLMGAANALSAANTPWGIAARVGAAFLDPADKARGRRVMTRLGRSVAILVDDLDRCPSEHLAHTLLFLEQIVSFPNTTTILALDPARCIQALSGAWSAGGDGQATAEAFLMRFMPIRESIGVLEPAVLYTKFLSEINLSDRSFVQAAIGALGDWLGSTPRDAVGVFTVVKNLQRHYQWDFDAIPAFVAGVSRRYQQLISEFPNTSADTLTHSTAADPTPNYQLLQIASALDLIRGGRGNLWEWNGAHPVSSSVVGRLIAGLTESETNVKSGEDLSRAERLSAVQAMVRLSHRTNGEAQISERNVDDILRDVLKCMLPTLTDSAEIWRIIGSIASLGEVQGLMQTRNDYIAGNIGDTNFHVFLNDLGQQLDAYDFFSGASLSGLVHVRSNVEQSRVILRACVHEWLEYAVGRPNSGQTKVAFDRLKDWHAQALIELITDDSCWFHLRAYWKTPDADDNRRSIYEFVLGRVAAAYPDAREADRGTVSDRLWEVALYYHDPPSDAIKATIESIQRQP